MIRVDTGAAGPEASADRPSEWDSMSAKPELPINALSWLMVLLLLGALIGEAFQ